MGLNVTTSPLFTSFPSSKELPCEKNEGEQNEESEKRDDDDDREELHILERKRKRIQNVSCRRLISNFKILCNATRAKYSGATTIGNR